MNRDKNRTGAERVFAEEKNIKGFGKNTKKIGKYGFYFFS